MTANTDQLKDEATTALINLIHSVSDGAATAKDFVVTNVPDVLQEMIKWQIGLMFISWVLLACVVAVGWWITCRVCDQSLEYGSSWRIPKVISSIITGVSILICTIVAIGNTYDGMMAWIAPKLFLLQTAMDLARHHH